MHFHSPIHQIPIGCLLNYQELLKKMEKQRWQSSRGDHHVSKSTIMWQRSINTGAEYHDGEKEERPESGSFQGKGLHSLLFFKPSLQPLLQDSTGFYP